MSKVIKCSDWSSASKVVPVEIKPLCMMQELNKNVVKVENPLPDARNKAESIVHKAESEADAIRDQARNQGYEEGYNAGLASAAQTVDELVQKLESNIAAVSADRKAAVESIEPEMLKLCIEIVEKIIRHEVKTNPRVVMRTIKSCLRRIKDTNDVHIRVNPKEVAEVRAMRDELKAVSEGVPGVNIIDDRRVSAGGCVIESTDGDFDARIETQIDQIRKKLEDTYEDSRDHTCS